MKTNNPIKKQAKEVSKCFTKDKWMAGEHMKKFSTSTVTRETQITTTRYNYLPSRMAFKNPDNTKC